MAVSANYQQSFYDEVQQLLSLSQIKCSPSELHGIFCGIICSGEMGAKDDWLPMLLQSLKMPLETLSQHVLSLLMELFQQTQTQLQDITFDFQLFLPDDDADLDKRASALGQWCYGFIVGMDLMDIELLDDTSDEVHDILRRYQAISSLDYDEISLIEENEVDYMEVMEYVRMAVLMMYTELVMSPEKQVSALASETIH